VAAIKAPSINFSGTNKPLSQAQTAAASTGYVFKTQPGTTAIPTPLWSTHHEDAGGSGTSAYPVGG